MNNLIPLKNACVYSSDKIDIKEVTLENYITTDNLLQNKLGITLADNLPPKETNLVKYSKENILVANIRPYLKKIWFSNKVGGCSADVLVFKVNEGFDSKFVYYSLFRDDFFVHAMKGSKGTKMPRGDKAQIMEFLIPNLNLAAQQKIASVLSSLDTKIELNNRINTELEQITKTLYDYWFVQFDFPNEDGKPYKSSGGKMVYNEELKREIPEGWKVKSLGEISSFISRGISPKYIDSGGVCVLNQKCIRNRTIIYNRAKRNDNSERNAEPKRVLKYDILVNSTGVGTLGRVAVVNRLAEDFVTVDSHVTIIRANENSINKFYFGFSLLEKQKEIERFAYGSTGQVELSRSQLENLRIIAPSEETQIKFEKVYKNCLDKMALNAEENHQLTSLRDWLLPMLMNGQVKVKEPEKKLDMAAESSVSYKK